MKSPDQSRSAVEQEHVTPSSTAPEKLDHQKSSDVILTEKCFKEGPNVSPVSKQPINRQSVSSRADEIRSAEQTADGGEERG